VLPQALGRRNPGADREIEGAVDDTYLDEAFELTDTAARLDPICW
jgi:hypothetical protein